MGWLGLPRLLRLLVASASVLAAVSDASAQPAAGIDALAWLAGDWEMTTPSGQCIEEHWTQPSANMVIGMSRTVAGGKTVSFEFMRIEARPDGVFFVPQPGGRPPVDFKLSAPPGPNLVFENPGHADHLMRVIYTRRGEDAVFARIEGANAGTPFAADFTYRRSSNNLASRCGAVK